MVLNLFMGALLMAPVKLAAEGGERPRILVLDLVNGAALAEPVMEALHDAVLTALAGAPVEVLSTADLRRALDLRDHLELLIAALAMEQADPGCEAEPGEATTAGGDAYAPVCFGGRDVSERIFDTISWIVEHAGFARDGRNQTLCTRHAEHVLNCLQTPEPLDWNWDGEVEEVCDGRIADFGLSGGPDEVGSFITMMVEQAKR